MIAHIKADAEWARRFNKALRDGGPAVDNNPDKCQVQCHKGKSQKWKKIKLPQM